MLKQARRVMAAAFVFAVVSSGRASGQLDFTIDPTQGLPGITVSGQVDPADVAAFCVTDLAEFQARFEALLAGPFVGGNTEGELPQRFFPDPNNIVYENEEQLAYVLTLAVVLGIAADINGSAAMALPQTFVMTFIDVATQDPLGPLGSFDPVTGEGSVVVPDLEPGPYVIAAACVGPVFDIDLLEAGIRESADFLRSIGVEFGPDGPFSPEFVAFMREFVEDDPEDGFELLITFVSMIGPNLLQPIITPDAFGLAAFTILDQPETKDECKNGGWQQFAPLGFRNQGDCIRFFNTGLPAGTTAATAG